jgi:Domain of unknown function (DUF4439)
VHPRPTTRRAFLRRAGSTVLVATGATGLLAGCNDDADRPAESADPTAASDSSADDELVVRALEDSTQLAAAYDAVLARHQRLRSVLSTLRDDIQQHLDVLSGAAGDAATAPEKAPPGARSPRAARRELADLEETLAGRRRRDAVAADSGELGRLLASIAASHAQRQGLLARRSRADWSSAAPDPTSVAIEAGPVVEAMNATLAGEHAAIYAYGVIGGRLDFDSRPVRDAADAVDRHRDRRDGLTALVEVAGADPVAAEAGYLLPTPVDDLADARSTAQLVEDRCGVLYATLAATATDEVRAYAVDALIDAATRALAWGAETSPLPGLSA